MSGRRVLITGAGQRVGAAMAQAFSAAGFSVLLHHRRSAAAAEALAASLSASGPPCATAGADLATVEGCAALAAAALAWAGDAPIDVLVNNASDYRPRPFGQIAAADLDGMMAIHARAPLLLAQALARRSGARGCPAAAWCSTSSTSAPSGPRPASCPML